MKIWKVALIGGTALVILLMFLGLSNNPRFIPSPLVDRPAPEFIPEGTLDGGGPIRLASMKGKWVLVNFWGSWCISCIREHPVLMQVAKRVAERPDMEIVGVDFKDTREGARNFLARHGDPGYRHIFDPDQRVAIDWGVYGAPETFLVDPQGVVRFKNPGPIWPGWFDEKIMPFVTGGKS